MPVVSPRTQTQLLCDAIQNHIRDFGKDNKVLCYAYCQIGDRIVGSFRLDKDNQPEVVLVNAKGESLVMPAVDFNEIDCKRLQDAIIESADVSNYCRCCDEINRQTELANSIEKLMKDCFVVSGCKDKLVVKNKFPLEIAGNKVVGFQFDPEKNKTLGGAYEVVFTRGRTEWIWNLGNKTLEAVKENIQKNLEYAKTHKKSHRPTI